MNRKIFGNKLECCREVRAAGIPVPDLSENGRHAINGSVEVEDNWIVKPLWSFGGRGIVPFVGQGITAQQYLQKRITNRRYELRVHAVKWLPVEEWLVSKRTHPDGDAQLTWNHHQGGSFSNIEMNESNTGVFKRAKQYAKKVIETLGYDFSAVDFIVQNAPSGVRELPVWFIEANLAPGFSTPATKEFYFNAFMKLAQEDIPAVSIPPSVPVQETPAAATARSMTADKRMTIISWLTSGNNSFEELIAYINTLR